MTPADSAMYLHVLTCICIQYMCSYSILSVRLALDCMDSFFLKLIVDIYIIQASSVHEKDLNTGSRPLTCVFVCYTVYGAFTGPGFL